MEREPDSVMAVCTRQEQTLNLILQELNTINNTLDTLKKQMNLVLGRSCLVHTRSESGSRTHSKSEQHVFEPDPVLYRPEVSREHSTSTQHDLILYRTEQSRDPDSLRVCTSQDPNISKILIYLDTMDNKIDDIKESTENMDNHISFIEKVYDTVAQPFMYIVNKLSYKNNIQLPELKYNDMSRDLY